MNASYLRIGNLVLEKDEVVKVGFNTFKIWNDFRLSTFLNPIPLTEEWLKKFGFENEMDEIDGQGYNIYFVTGTNYLVEYFFNDKTFVFTDDMGLKITLSYVHQLQNLYFALTQTELTLS